LLGGPFGMLGGIGVLGIIAMAVSVISKFGIDEVAKAVVKKIIKQGKSKDTIIKEIDSFPIISKNLKRKLKEYVNLT